jgi:hypothetical protein
MVAHTFNPNTQEAAAIRICKFKGSPGYKMNPVRQSPSSQPSYYHTHTQKNEQVRAKHVQVYFPKLENITEVIEVTVSV